jgi:hypothetical protein
MGIAKNADFRPMRRYTQVWAYAAAVSLMLTVVPNNAATQETMIQPGTAAASQVIATLNERKHHDRDQAHSYSGGENNERGMFYYGKVREIDALLITLQSGRPIAAADVQHALDNAGAIQYGND